MQKCQQCGKELNREQIWHKRKYCSRQCSVESRVKNKIEWNGVWLYPGKGLEVLKLCYAGMTPTEACQTVGAHYSTIRRLRENPETAALLSKRTCPVCGGNVPFPLNRKYCSEKCQRKARYARNAAAKGTKPRSYNYERRQEAIELYQRGFHYALIAEMLNVPKQRAKNWIYRSDITKEFRSLRHQLENANTVDEWTETLRNSTVPAERSDTVILVCSRLHGSGAPGRYVSIAAEQFWCENFHGGTCVAFCNILKNAITTVEWRGENFHLTRTFKVSGTFVWPDEKLGKSIEVTRAEFERLICLKKQNKNAENTCISTSFVI